MTMTHTLTDAHCFKITLNRGIRVVFLLSFHDFIIQFGRLKSLLARLSILTR
jgi:hypothetical protein